MVQQIINSRMLNMRYGWLVWTSHTPKRRQLRDKMEGIDFSSFPYRNNAEIVKQYESFIELTLASAIQVADKYWNIKDPALALLERHMIYRNLNLNDFIIL